MSPFDQRFQSLRRREATQLFAGIACWTGTALALAAVWRWLPQPVTISAVLLGLALLWYWRRIAPGRAVLAAAYRDLAGSVFGFAAGPPLSDGVDAMALDRLQPPGGRPVRRLDWGLRGRIGARPVAICNLRLGTRIGNVTSGGDERTGFDGLVIEIDLPAGCPSLVLGPPDLPGLRPAAIARDRLTPPEGLPLPDAADLRLWLAPGADADRARQIATVALQGAASALDPAQERLVALWLDPGRATVCLALTGRPFPVGMDLRRRAPAAQDLNAAVAGLGRLLTLTSEIIAAAEDHPDRRPGAG